MDLKLHIIKRDDVEDYSQRNRFCFAVIDLSKSKSYPSNYVCVLPLQPRKSNNENSFEKVFGEKSVEQAKMLLTGALKTVDDSEVRVEIERRLKLLEPKQDNQMQWLRKTVSASTDKKIQTKLLRRMPQEKIWRQTITNLR